MSSEGAEEEERKNEVGSTPNAAQRAAGTQKGAPAPRGTRQPAAEGRPGTGRDTLRPRPQPDRPEPQAAPRATALLRGVQSGQARADTEQTGLGAAGRDGADCLAGSGRCLGAAITLWNQTAAAAQHRECSTCRRITRF